MRQCPKCGKSEREIEMTTMALVESDNDARCPCGWVGKVGDLVTNFGKGAEEWRAELDAREKSIEEREAKPVSKDFDVAGYQVSGSGGEGFPTTILLGNKDDVISLKMDTETATGIISALVGMCGEILLDGLIDKAPRSLGEIVSDIMPYPSEEAQGYLSEDNAAWKSGEIPQGIVIENLPDTGIPPVERMTKTQLVEALTALGVEFDPKAKRDDLFALYTAEQAKAAPSA
jgi:hypothetical protein